MLNLILLVQTPSDVASLPGSIPVLKRLPLAACWLIYSPAVVVDVAAAHAEIDKQIAARNQAIREAAGREDFTGAEAHRIERDALVIRKAAVATDGIKASTPEQRAAMAEKVFGVFFDAKVAPSVEITEHTQHFELRDWNEMMNGLKGRWPSILPHGGFMVTWPGQVEEMATSPTRTIPVTAQEVQMFKDNPTPPAIPKTQVATEPQRFTAEQITPEKKPRKQTYMQTPRFKFLCALGIDAIYEEARKVGIINPSGTKKQIIHAVARKEWEAQKVAA
jgi:hypothetical protein